MGCMGSRIYDPVFCAALPAVASVESTHALMVAARAIVWLRAELSQMTDSRDLSLPVFSVCLSEGFLSNGCDGQELPDFSSPRPHSGQPICPLWCVEAVTQLHE
jgi:hypothetical protein